MSPKNILRCSEIKLRKCPLRFRIHFRKLRNVDFHIVKSFLALSPFFQSDLRYTNIFRGASRRFVVSATIFWCIHISFWGGTQVQCVIMEAGFDTNYGHLTHIKVNFTLCLSLSLFLFLSLSLSLSLSQVDWRYTHIFSCRPRSIPRGDLRYTTIFWGVGVVLSVKRHIWGMASLSSRSPRCCIPPKPIWGTQIFPVFFQRRSEVHSDIWEMRKPS